jgi:signal transduction histidine kinase
VSLSRILTTLGRREHPAVSDAQASGAAAPIGWAFSRRAVATVAVAALLVLTGGALAFVQAQSREQLLDRFDLRNALGARFAESYSADILAREALVGATELSAEVVSQADFERVIASFGFEAVVLLDSAGNAINSMPLLAPADRVGVGSRYAHLAAAIAGRPAISNVVASAAKGTPVVAFAVPYETPFGRRVLSGAFPVVRTPLAAYLENAIPFATATVYLVDTAGRIVASNGDEDAVLSALEGSAAELAAALKNGANTFQANGDTHYLASQAVAGTPFSVVSSVSLSTILAPVEGPVLWAPWLVLGGMALLALYLLRVLSALSRSQVGLAAATTELERSNRELHDFAAVASHDLQEPLRKIQSFGALLAEKSAGTLSTDSSDYLVRMQQAAARMQALVQDLLEYSRVAAGPAVTSTVDLNVVLAEVLVDLEARVASTGGRVDVGVMPTVVASPLEMRQLFQNLVANALKFHRDGVPPEVRVEASAWRRPGQRPGWRFQVSDSGIGFDERFAEQIFTPFKRLHGRQAYQGTGLGLAICRRIAERLGGTISAKSAVGAGTTFTVLVPAA